MNLNDAIAKAMGPPGAPGTEPAAAPGGEAAMMGELRSVIEMLAADSSSPETQSKAMAALQIIDQHMAMKAPKGAAPAAPPGMPSAAP